MQIPASILITGANRGIGLGLVKQFLALSEVKHVFAGTRNPDAATELGEITDNRLTILKLDVENDESIERAYEQVSKTVGESGLNVLVNNAGVLVPYHIDGAVSRKDLISSFNVNTIGAAICTQVFLPLIRKAAEAGSGDHIGADRAAIVNVSSMWGSISRNMDGSAGDIRAMGYKMSKAALNQFAKTLSVDFAATSEPILVVNFCPGWVQTDMGGKNAMISVDESTSSLVKAITNAKQSGFFDRDLKPMDY